MHDMMGGQESPGRLPGPYLRGVVDKKAKKKGYTVVY